jgi:uncharacterized spore protein YtfJ
MEQVKQMLQALAAKLEKLAKANGVVGRKISVGQRHVIPLCELSLAMGGGGGVGEGGEAEGKADSKGTGGGAGGAAKATPVAVIVVDGNTVRVEKLGR